MRDTFRLGRIAGVSIGISWTLLAVTALLTFGLAGGRYPGEAPGHTGTEYAVAGALTAVLFLVSVLVHELSHALVAKREGMEVDGISLWLLGGVTRIEGEAPTPASEVRISGAGPLASMAIALGFLAVAAVADLVAAPRLVVAVAAWLGTINLILALFNVLPGAPLDGGRLVHAFVWWRTGDRLRATVTASRAGRAVGIVLIAIGLALFAYNGSADGLWLAMIGWFLINAARTEQGQAQLRHALDGMRVGDVMTPDPMVGPGWFTVQGFIDSYLLNHRHSAFPIEAWGGGLAGLVTLNRLRAVPAEQRGVVRVLDIAAPMAEVPTATPDELLVDLLGRMHGGGDGRALVLEDGRLVGIVTSSDVTRAMAHSSLRSPARS
jgi:Zn-dependent protease/CBS domain-containing protein